MYRIYPAFKGRYQQIQASPLVLCEKVGKIVLQLGFKEYNIHKNRKSGLSTSVLWETYGEVGNYNGSYEGAALNLLCVDKYFYFTIRFLIL
jgi:hypothetical protein